MLQRAAQGKEERMHSILHRTGTILGLVLLLCGGLSWGQLPPGNDISDPQGNTGGGLGALQDNAGGVFNTAYGRGALEANTTGDSNTASGRNALQANTEGERNTASGAFVLSANTTGDSNTASGYFALFRNTRGFDNIALGALAGSNLTGGNSNIYLGHRGAATESNTMRLGQNQTRTFIAGVANVPVSGMPVVITSTGQLGIQLGIQPSSARYKRDIEPLGAQSQGVF
jgi:hypothetical protein